MPKGIKGFQKGHTINIGRECYLKTKIKIKKANEKSGVLFVKGQTAWNKNLSKEKQPRFNKFLKTSKQIKDRIIKYHQQYVIENKTYLLLYKKKYRRKNLKDLNRKNRLWRKNNPEKARILKLNRLSRLKNIIHSFSADDLYKLKEKYNGRCPHCNKFKKLTLDHIIPISKVSKGFIYKIKDIQFLCQSCNSSKSASIKF